MSWHPMLGAFVGSLAGFGILSCSRSIRVIRQWDRVGSLSVLRSNPSDAITVWSQLRNTVVTILSSHLRSPWLSDQHVEHSLRQSLSTHTLHTFRQSQILAATSATLVSLFWCVLKVIGGEPIAPLGILLLCGGAFIGGGWFSRWKIRRAATDRSAQIQLELPAITDLMAFAVSAGEPITVALRRLSDSCSGEIVRELRRVDAALASGVSLVSALQSLAKDLEIPAVSRLIRAITSALERGTQMAEVLRAQASDSRAEAMRSLLEEAGKKETAMMIPVVFIILPIIVAVALYPGLVELNLLQS